MPNTKVIIAAASLIGLIILLIVVVVVTHKASGVSQNCPSEVESCPEADELYSLEARKCFRKGESPEGICSRNMVILPVYNCKKQGRCECDYNHDRWLIYHNVTNECYYVYTQGYCEPGQWLEISQRGGVECTPNICLKEWEEHPGEEMNYVPYNNSCQKLFSTNIPGCSELRFYRGRNKPLCVKPKVQIGGVGAIPPADCPAGSFQAVNGHCQPRIEFDFGD